MTNHTDSTQLSEVSQFTRNKIDKIFNGNPNELSDEGRMMRDMADRTMNDEERIQAAIFRSESKKHLGCWLAVAPIPALILTYNLVTATQEKPASIYNLGYWGFVFIFTTLMTLGKAHEYREAKKFERSLVRSAGRQRE